MIKIPVTLFAILLGSSLGAEALVATRTIRANTILTEADVAIDGSLPSNGLTNPKDAIGLEARIVLYSGRPIHIDDLSPPAIVRRNQLVPLIFNNGGLQITTVGRALDRGAVGEIIQVMNVSSRSSLFGVVLPNGAVSVD